MSHLATERLRLAPAPGGLALVQDLLNTRQIGPDAYDLLGTVDGARYWLRQARTTDPTSTDDAWLRDLSEPDLTTLRALRTDVERLLSAAGQTAAGPVARLALVSSADGELGLEPDGHGLSGFAAEVWAQVFLAQLAGTWKRLKLCHNPPCASAFYDRSRNNSGVWHDVKTCGNAVNLRASRARRRATTAPGEPS
jgi:predicted RNA-binding Zn ribbon-like protein